MQINILDKIGEEKAVYALKECINAARLSGIKIYLVGGIVRDILLQNKVKDIDITVEANVKDFIDVLIGNSQVEFVKYQEKLPTAKVMFKNGVEVDFASTREEVYNNSGELPVAVDFGCPLEMDIKRRDFTVNSIAVSLNEADIFRVIDFLGGLNDLQNKQLRVLHDKSFYDDPSRIIRAAKFSQRLNFSLDIHTQELQKEYLENPVRNIPLFRVCAELFELFALNRAKIFDCFITNKIYSVLMDTCSCPVDGKMIEFAVEKYGLADRDIPLLYFAALYINENIPEKINLSYREQKVIKDIKILLLNDIEYSDKYSIYKFFYNKDYLSIILYGLIKNSIYADEFFKIIRSNPKILITGNDLKKLGIAEGKIYSEILDSVLKEKINNGLQSKDDEINFVKNFLKSSKGIN